MKSKIKTQKSPIQNPLLIAIIVFIIIGAGIGVGVIEYQRTFKLIEEAKQLTNEEKYNEAIKKLNLAQNSWIVTTLGLKRQEITDKIEINKILFEDKSEYIQGIEEFNRRNWEMSKELLLRVSEISPYYRAAQNIIEKARESAKVPVGYYFTDKFPNRVNTQQELEEFLFWDFELPKGYQVGIFDCSESAAYLEWALEDAGFDVWIAMGPAPWDPAYGLHAWVIVYTYDATVAIEATALTGYGLWDLIKGFFTGKIKGVVYQGDRGWYNYYNPPYLFSDIYEAVQEAGFGAEEWNWWKGFWGFI